MNENNTDSHTDPIIPPAVSVKTSEAIAEESQNNPKNKNKYTFIVPVLVLLFVTFTALALSKFYGTKKADKPEAIKEETYDNSCTTKVADESSYGKFIEGQILLEFDWDVKFPDALEFLEKENLKEIRNDKLSKPLSVNIIWTKDFMRKQDITTTEVNELLTEIRKEPYISEVIVSTYWHIWPMPTDYKVSQYFVQKIDRWGNFTVVFSDNLKKDLFFSKYPKITFLSDGEAAGLFFRKVNPYKITVLYNAGTALNILKEIRENIGKGDYIEIPSKYAHTQYETVNGERLSLTQTGDKYPVIFLNNPRNVEDTGYITGFGIEFPNSFTLREIYDELKKYPEIDSDIIEIPLYKSGGITVAVPPGQELCRFERYKENPLLKTVSPVYIDFSENEEVVRIQSDQ